MVLPQQTTALATADWSPSFFTTHFAKHITSCTCSFVLIFLFNLWLMLACSWHAVMVTYFTMSASPPSKNTGHAGVHFNHYLSGFIFRSRWFLQGYSIISSPRSLYSLSIQPLQNNQSRIVLRVWDVQGEHEWRQQSPLWSSCTAHLQIRQSIGPSHILWPFCQVVSSAWCWMFLLTFPAVSLSVAAGESC